MWILKLLAADDHHEWWMGGWMNDDEKYIQALFVPMLIKLSQRPRGNRWCHGAHGEARLYNRGSQSPVRWSVLEDHFIVCNFMQFLMRNPEPSSKYLSRHSFQPKKWQKSCNFVPLMGIWGGVPPTRVLNKVWYYEAIYLYLAFIKKTEGLVNNSLFGFFSL